MSRQTFTLGRLFDIRVGVHVSWLAVYAFMTVALARGLGMVPGPEAYVLATFCSSGLFASVVAHEFAHALIAKGFGVRTDAITLFLFGGGATLHEEPASPKADALVAVAGPAMSAVLAALSLGAAAVVQRIVPGTSGEALGLLAAYLAVANGVLAVFNLIPAYPMDGGRILRALLWLRRGDRDGATALAAWVGIVFAIVFVALGVLFVATTRHLAYGWYTVLGAFLLRQAWAQVHPRVHALPRPA